MGIEAAPSSCRSARSAAFLLLWFVGLFWGLAEASEPIVEVVAPAGVLHPGRSTPIFVAVAPAPGAAPQVQVSAGSLVYGGTVGPGIWAYQLVPPVKGNGVGVQVILGERVHDVRLPIRVPGPSRLELPDRIDGLARGGEVVFRVTGHDLPPPEALQVVVGEGRVLSVRAVDGALEVRIQPEDSPFPRAFPVGVRDQRREQQPAWSLVRLRARPVVPLHSEPGSTVVLTVGGRTYGPHIADDEGAVTIPVDQFPGETVAHAIVLDDLGNETRTDLPLAASAHPILVAFPTGEIVPGAPPPLVWLHAVGADGARVVGPAPACRTPAVDLPVREVSRGRWLLAVPEAVETELDHVRVVCTLGEHVAHSFRVPAATGVPDRLKLRVWPTDLRADFPAAELRVVLEDARGERLPVEGVRVRAGRGDVVLEHVDERVARGEYVGTAAVAAGRDVVTAVYEAPHPGHFVSQLELAWGDVPPGPDAMVQVHARALDPCRQPVPEVLIELDAGAASLTVPTGPDGWASATVPLPDTPGPVVLRARHDERERRMVVQRGQDGEGGPGTPDLVDAHEVTISPGRVAGISVEIEPSVLRAAPGSLATIRVSLEDRTGSAITDEPITLQASEGRVGPLRPRPDGSFVAEYAPIQTDRAREVEISARTESLRSTTTLRVEPRLVRVSVGPWAGVQSNFGAIGAPIVGLDTDVRVRTRVFGDSAMVRVGVGHYAFTHEVTVGLQHTATLQSTVVPAHLAFLFRHDMGPVGAWMGGGVALAFHHMELRFDDDLVGRGMRLRAGPMVDLGLSRRALGGELAALLRLTWLTSSGGEFGYSGNVGGLAAGVGYRVVF